MGFLKDTILSTSFSAMLRPDITLVLIISSWLGANTITLAQPLSERITPQTQGWYRLEEQFKPGSNWEIRVELENRRNRFFNSDQQYLGRVTALFQALHRLQVGGGFAYFAQEADSLQALDDPLGTELRPHQDFIWQITDGKNQFEYRLRMEERFQRKVSSTDVDNDYNFVFRNRLMVQCIRRLIPEKGGGSGSLLDLEIQEELFLNTVGTGDFCFFNQNRLYAGLVYKQPKPFSVELGVLHQFQQRNIGNEFWNRFIIRVALVHQWHLSQSR